ncbi:MAG: O-antigen polymerase [Neisseria sp.]|uniref:O-antigen polymerase n=1 Tax=Neisseria sp. TaxID=192066 RepID=UPI0026DD8D8F|nr:O-antigen polymerase [Neisseria sp.]MDO4248250.1 O-antigen polymerase [Neisseria sp.]
MLTIFILCILIAITLFGLFVAKLGRYGPFNPFTLYFGVWAAIFIIYMLFQDVYYAVSEEYLLIQICVHLFAFCIMVATQLGKPIAKSQELPYEYVLNKKLFTLVQIILILALPEFYQMVVGYAGQNIFTSTGYTRLRYAFNNEGKDMGRLGYLFTFAFLSAAIGVFYAAKKQLNKWQAVLAVLLALFYAFLTTGRTFFLMIFLFTVIPLALLGKIKAKSLLVLSGGLLSMFLLVALLTSKGASADASFGDNILSFIDSVHNYLIAPFVALSLQMSDFNSPAFGDYSLRFFFSVLSAFGLTNPPISLVRGYEFTPVPTNLYTVYEVYVRDFAIAGFFIPVLFLPIHWYLYKKACRGNEFYIILYAISAYPLMTQVLQDQYMSLISTWIQLLIGCFLLMRKKKKPLGEITRE